MGGGGRLKRGVLCGQRVIKFTANMMRKVSEKVGLKRGVGALSWWGGEEGIFTWKYKGKDFSGEKKYLTTEGCMVSQQVALSSGVSMSAVLMMLCSVSVLQSVASYCSVLLF